MHGDRAAVFRRGLVKGYVVDLNVRGVSREDRAAHAVGGSLVERVVGNNGGAAVDVDRAAVFRGGSFELDILDGQRSVLVVNRSKIRAIAYKARIYGLCRVFVVNANDGSVAQVIDERAFICDVAREARSHNRQLGVAGGVDQVALLHYVVREGHLLNRQFAFVFENGARLG